MSNYFKGEDKNPYTTLDYIISLSFDSTKSLGLRHPVVLYMRNFLGNNPDFIIDLESNKTKEVLDKISEIVDSDTKYMERLVNINVTLVALVVLDHLRTEQEQVKLNISKTKS